MPLSFTVLGCGTSAGVPRIGNDWGSCDPADPKNRRTRVSLLVQSETTTLLVDTSPDMREQLLRAEVIALDAVLWTHDHADHCHGIDDLRQVYHHRTYMGRHNEPIDGYARAPTLKLLRQRFAYAFEGREGYRPIVAGHSLPDELMIGDIQLRCVDMPHGAIWSTGFRFEHDGRSVGYATDFHETTDAMVELFTGVDVWVVDALREKPHPTHPHLAQTLDAITCVAPGRAYLTHMDNSLDYERLCAVLPPHVRPAYDGLREAA
ncbi:MBL fold metallo-hydrolase [Sphingobium sp. DEHP117]|uniref:MBL fold metallo-hydrolase n=1 Tax=Sphingobium sp. DEHP117 TaxID=2993436 RepID=UPI0027D49610|nr:MBL fold metallo-hydrolase [Sphingobium sp. DEHP117]MDQ4419762.1 MBL fold metallo-hydrolase [Sphingobium sp. DEHP117]